MTALLIVFGIAFFLRTYFVYGTAIPDRLYSGGSDSFYHEQIIRHAYQTGHQLTVHSIPRSFFQKAPYPLDQVVCKIDFDIRTRLHIGNILQMLGVVLQAEVEYAVDGGGKAYLAGREIFAELTR